jgi:hypothetical protein
MAQIGGRGVPVGSSESMYAIYILLSTLAIFTAYLMGLLGFFFCLASLAFLYASLASSMFLPAIPPLGTIQ